MNKFKIGERVRCIKVKAGAENWLTGNEIYEIVPYVYNSQEDFVIGDTGEYTNTFWGEFVKEIKMNKFKFGDNVRVIRDRITYSFTKVGSEGYVIEVPAHNELHVEVRFHKFTGLKPERETKFWILAEDLELINDEIKIGDEVYFIPSYAYSGNKVYGIVRHIGKLPSTIGEDGCVWSEWDREWDGKINSTSLGWMPKEKVYKVYKEEKMSKLKAGDRVKQIVIGCGFKSPYAIVTRVEENRVWHIHDGETEELNCEPSWLVLASQESTMSRYQKIKARIKNLQIGWNKEADDILSEMKVNHRIAIRRDADTNRGEIEVSLCSAWDDTSVSETFHYTSQCEKLDAFKQALLWLLDHSDIKRDEKEEKIKEIEKQRDELSARIRSLNLKIEDLRS